MGKSSKPGKPLGKRLKNSKSLAKYLFKELSSLFNGIKPYPYAEQWEFAMVFPIADETQMEKDQDTRECQGLPPNGRGQ
jgi:hypothetical protein